jgi:hypothetical protein
MDNNMYGNNGVVNGQFGGPVQMMPQQNAQQVMPVNCDTPMNITTLADLQSYAAGTIVRFPDFAEGQPFVARVRRPSMLVLAKQGKIPNTLLTAAGELFSKGGAGMDADNENMLSDVYDIMHIICEASLIQPTMKDIEDAGLSLSDDQLMAIFNYTQNGVKALESFRKE